jgi:hypothetical protein
VEQGMPGNEWKVPDPDYLTWQTLQAAGEIATPYGSNTIRYDYGTNTASDEVRKIELVNNTTLQLLNALPLGLVPAWASGRSRLSRTEIAVSRSHKHIFNSYFKLLKRIKSR